MPTSRVKYQGLLWHLNKLYLIATTEKEHMTFKMLNRYTGGHQSGRFCNSFLPTLWKPKRWLLPPSHPRLNFALPHGLALGTVCIFTVQGCIYTEGIFLLLLFLILACEMPGESSILMARKQFQEKMLSAVYISYTVRALSPQAPKHVYASTDLWTLSLIFTSQELHPCPEFPMLRSTCLLYFWMEPPVHGLWISWFVIYGGFIKKKNTLCKALFVF